VPSKPIEPVTVKLCCNGSLHMTGCLNVMTAIEAINVIFKEFSQVKAIKDYEKNIMIEKPFVENMDELSFDRITKFKVCMINSNFNIHFRINRPKLYQLLKHVNVECYLSESHAGVNIKYHHPEHIVSIFVFESGKIVITGGYNCRQIASAYNFIKKYLITYKKFILVDDDAQKKNIQTYMTKE
jgi:TATA-box binding protein (TBP) (component of TFIID and TFIIIB)